MDLFTAIDNTHGIIRLPKGVEKQVKLYRRGERVYVPHSGGYVEVRYENENGTFTTAHPDVKLLEHDKFEGKALRPEMGRSAMGFIERKKK